jgi:hypothetical protein
LYDFVAFDQLVSHRKAEQMQDLFSALVGTLTLLGIKWQLPDLFAVWSKIEIVVGKVGYAASASPCCSSRVIFPRAIRGGVTVWRAIGGTECQNIRQDRVAAKPRRCNNRPAAR